ncbi:MAG: DUF2949 domain-containing protein [Cyanobacteria bacterium]|nr:DUF2949 domain-containing protein [Cyanobacteriota bacterium]MDW8199895.1 DUF2949 domain-containing protein [Cyanobacteriota bacterium SKYGB_h_bin112]
MNTYKLVSFLENELKLPTDEIRLALDHCDEPINLPMVLWQYGLVNLNQLDQIFDWMFSCTTSAS